MSSETPFSPPAVPARSPSSLDLAGEQALVVMADEAGFINRGLASLWRAARPAAVPATYAQAARFLIQDQAAELAGLLQQSAALSGAVGDDGECLLTLAARSGSLGCARILLEHGAAVDGAAASVATPFLQALDAGHGLLARMLLAHGADASACLPDSHDSALHLAAARGLLDLLPLLLEAGLSLGQMRDRHAYDDELGVHLIATALHVAALNDRGECVAWLLKAGADRDACAADGRQPVHYAAARGALAALEVLLAAGADPDVPDACEQEGIVMCLSPLHYAVINAHVEAAALLLCYGADPALCEAGSGESALQMAWRSENDALIQLLDEAVRGVEDRSVFSRLDDCFLSCSRVAYTEALPFLRHLLSEAPPEQRSLLVLSDWLAQMLGAEQRPYLAQAYREVSA